MTADTPPRARRALLLIDFQRDFLAGDGRMPVARNQVGPVLAARESLSSRLGSTATCSAAWVNEHYRAASNRSVNLQVEGYDMVQR